MTDYGVKLTKAGKSIDSTDSRDYIFNTKFQTLNIYKKGRGTTSFDALGNSTVSHHHDLGYKPINLSFFENNNGSGWWWADGTRFNNTITECGWNYGDSFTTRELWKARMSNGNGDAGTVNYSYVLFTNAADIPGHPANKPASVSDYGFKASVENHDVKDATFDKLITSSRFQTLKFHNEYQVDMTVTTSDGAKQETVDHALGYHPIFWATISTPISGYSQQHRAPYGRVPQGVATSVAVNKQTIRCTYLVATPVNGTIRYRIIVFKDRMLI